MILYMRLYIKQHYIYIYFNTVHAYVGVYMLRIKYIIDIYSTYLDYKLVNAAKGQPSFGRRSYGHHDQSIVRKRRLLCAFIFWLRVCLSFGFGRWRRLPLQIFFDDYWLVVFRFGFTQVFVDIDVQHFSYAEVLVEHRRRSTRVHLSVRHHPDRMSRKQRVS